MRRFLYLFVVGLVVLSMSSVEAGIFRRQPRCSAGQCKTTTVSVPMPLPPTGTARMTTRDYASALALINAERARVRRGPLAWSADLAAWATRNHGRITRFLLTRRR